MLSRKLRITGRRSWWRSSTRAALAVVCACAAAPAAAQVAAGGDIARHVGLGGGGVALQGVEVSPIINPAALATPVGFRLRFSRLGYGGTGEINQEAWRLLIRTKDLERLKDLGLDLARYRTRMWTENGVGVRFSTWHLDLAGAGQLAGDPNAALQRWVRQGAAFFPPPNARLVASQGYYLSPSVGYGHRWRLRGDLPGSLDAGARVKLWIGRYRQVRFRGVPDGSGFDIVDRETADVKDQGWGADLGFRFVPDGEPNLSFGLSVLGLVEPSIGEMRQERTFNLGTAYRLSPRLTLVADLLNVTGANERRVKVATGAEYTVVPGWITLRGAVTSRGLAGGIGLGPIQVAFTRDGETTLGTQIRF
ncbi:MAG: hypothetical protein ACK47B_04135 [Armatimonadota bacterium]